MSINFHFTDQLQCFVLMLVFQNGAVLDRSLQPYESHIPFILQFLVNTFWQLSHWVGVFVVFFSVLRIKHAKCGCQMNYWLLKQLQYGYLIDFAGCLATCTLESRQLYAPHHTCMRWFPLWCIWLTSRIQLCIAYE